MIINAENLIAGRLAAFAAKKALLGETIDIINSEKAVISGNKKFLRDHYTHRMKRGTPEWGPFLYTAQEYRFLKRLIRGMLPYHQAKGKNALARIHCYNSIPPEFKDKKIETIAGCSLMNSKIHKYLTIQQLLQLIKGKQ